MLEDDTLFKSNEKDCLFLRHGLGTKLNDGFDECSPAYLFSNENLTELFRSINVQDKDILTACAGSGDILFNSKLRGAGRVDQFDVSLFSKHVYEIKYQAFKNLTYAEFLRFFYHSKAFLNKKSGDKIAPHLSQQATYLLKTAQSSKYCAEWMFRMPDSDFVPLTEVYPRKSPHIISQGNYDLTRKSLPLNSSFYTTELTKLPTILERKYDIIYLSNICQYIEYTQDFEDTVVNPLATHLKNNGKIICYQLGGLSDYWSLLELEQQFGNNNKWEISMDAMKNICSPNRYQPGKNKYKLDTVFTMEKTR